GSVRPPISENRAAKGTLILPLHFFRKSPAPLSSREQRRIGHDDLKSLGLLLQDFAYCLKWLFANRALKRWPIFQLFEDRGLNPGPIAISPVPREHIRRL